MCWKSDLEREKKDTKNPEKEKASDKKMNKLVEEFEDIFKGIGKYGGEPVKNQLTDDVSPIIQPPRQIPLCYI